MTELDVKAVVDAVGELWPLNGQKSEHAWTHLEVETFAEALFPIQTTGTRAVDALKRLRRKSSERYCRMDQAIEAVRASVPSEGGAWKPEPFDDPYVPDGMPFKRWVEWMHEKAAEGDEYAMRVVNGWRRMGMHKQGVGTLARLVRAMAGEARA